MRSTIIFATVLLAASGPAPRLLAAGIGEFESETNVGHPRQGTPAQFKAAQGEYQVSGGGENMWATNDAFHYVWKKVSGDVSLAADIGFSTSGGNAHKKACLLIRQDLDSNSGYVDAAVHGNGLTSLQFRDVKGGFTHEVQSNVTGPSRVRLEKRGHEIAMSIARAGEKLHPSGASIRLAFAEPFYIGLAVCSHDDTVLETAVFSAIDLKLDGALANASNLARVSTLETIAISSTDRRVVFWTTNHIEAPSWSHDGAAFFFKSEGRFYRLPAAGGEPQLIEAGFATRNDHGISPDGKWIAFLSSDPAVKGHPDNQDVLLQIMPAAGGNIRVLTKLFGGEGTIHVPSWSPDSRQLVFASYHRVPLR